MTKSREVSIKLIFLISTKICNIHLSTQKHKKEKEKLKHFKVFQMFKYEYEISSFIILIISINNNDFVLNFISSFSKNVTIVTSFS